jgi:hypothetical protein
MISKRVALLVCALAILLVVSPSGLNAQMAGTGQVAGVVADPSGAVIAGATVTLTDTATSAVRTAVTNDAGRYNFSNVEPGTYSLIFTKPGFRVDKIGAQKISVGSALTIDAKLEVGATSETVEVVATNTELQTMNATVGNTITGIALDSLPSLGRDVSTFVTLQPGVSPDGSVAGANQDQNSFMLDGGNNSSDMDGTMNTYTPSFAGDPTGGLVNFQVTATAPAGSAGGGGPTGVMPMPADSVEEFKVGTSNQTADFNMSSGAQVQLVTKRGSNQWHGTGYWYYLDNHWSANSFDNNAGGTPLASYHYNRFGAAGGGPIISKKVLGGEWYIFANYEGFRWPGSVTVTKAVPSALMKQGILQYADANGVVQYYNMTSAPVAVPGNPSLPSAVCPAGPCDPRGLWASPTVLGMWNQYMPASNVGTCGSLGSRCDHLNVQGFQANMLLPWDDNFGVVRLDHDFGAKWHFNSTYRYYKMVRATNNQVDIGGFYSGDKLGVPSAVSNRPQDPWYLTFGLTTNITNNVTNDFHYSYLRNYWARASNGQAPQVTGLGGALEPFGENANYVLAPVNLDTQDVRTRFWDGQDNMFRDDVSWLKGKHFIQFGGTYQRNWNYHQRTDNGGGINYQTVYWLGKGVGTLNGMNMTGYVPDAINTVGGSALNNYNYEYGILLGVPGVSQIAYTRTGANLTLNPPNTPAYDKVTIPYYNLYVSDSWRMKPTFTLSYGLGWALEMPPTEAQGKQINLVDSSGKPIDLRTYIKARESAALAGTVYNPEIGFALTQNVTGHPKYPYNPFYNGFSPRVAAAWNPSYDSGLLGDLFGKNKTVIRGGYSILYGRLNGVGLVLIPLLGDGLIQAVQCVSPQVDSSCAGSSGSTPTSSWRIGPCTTGVNCGTPGHFDGLVAPLTAASQTLPSPAGPVIFPGFNAAAAGAGTGLDPKFRPSMSQQFDLTIQRQITNKISVEAGYMGRILTHEFQPVNIGAVPYMMTLGGQRFDNAYGNMVWQYCGGNAGMAGGNCAKNLAAVKDEPFFDAALNPAYCVGFANCAQAVASKNSSNIRQANVWSLWSKLDNGAFNFSRSMLNTPTGAAGQYGTSGQLSSDFTQNTSWGTGTYNGMFVTLKMSQWHGMTLQSNFTYGKALGNGSQVQATSQYTISDPYDLNRNYGLQPWDRKFLFNTFLVYQPTIYQGQHGILGHVLGGWTFAPVLDMGSGLPLGVYVVNATSSVYNGGQTFGAADGSNVGSYDNAINICGGATGGSQRHNNPVSINGVGANGFANASYGPNLYQNPNAMYNCFRNAILGIDNGGNGGVGNYRGQAFWNVDLSVKKNIMVKERVSLEFGAIFTNLFNHVQLADPYNALSDTGDFGALEAQANQSRHIEVGLRIKF